jgi:nucleoside-diphosphate-sugar epimerase
VGIKGTLNVLQAARELDTSLVIHTSTSEVYGTAKYVPIDEAHPLQGQSPYSATKIAADQLANSFYTSFGTPVVTLRPFNTYGPRQSARAIIPTVITQIASGKTRINLGSITPTRDFSYISDTVDGFIAALESKQGIGKTFNLGSNFEISIEDTVHTISQLMGKKVEIKAEDVRFRPKNSEVERLWSRNSLALETFPWAPKFTGIEGFKNGLSKTIDWFEKKENLESYKYNEYNL